VLDKPSGLLSVPGKAEDMGDSAARRAQAAFPGALVVHRLDLDTSGVLLMALNRRAQGHLGQQFERRMTEKTYVALVRGTPPDEFGEIDLPLRTDWPNRPKQKVDHAEGRPALTRWRILAFEGGATRMALHPVTGRSHQLRVHMEALGCPILGDPLYGDEASRDAAPRLMLHALTLRLRHPGTGAPAAFTAPTPF
jgi:tRNA pseudouridine32 synthase/23S rRNA pseudouridine746 synthase